MRRSPAVSDGGDTRAIPRGHAAAFAVLLLLTVLRAWRVPNPYATAHWLFSYAHGFIPRGLVGTLFSPIAANVGPRIAYLSIAVLGAALVAGFFAAMMTASRALMRRHGPRSHLGLVPLVFVCSPAAVLAVHCVGYFDAGLFVLGIVAMKQIERERHAVAGVVCAVGVLVHELFVAVALPAVTVALLASTLLAEGRVAIRRMSFRWLNVLGPPLLVLATLLRFGSPGREALTALEVEVLSLELVRFDQAPWLFVPLESSVSDSLGRMSASWAERSLWEIGWDMGHHLPFVALAFGSLTIGVVRRASSRWRRAAVIAAAALAVVTPLALHLIAWDLNRIDAFTAVAALLVWLSIWGAPGEAGLEPLGLSWGLPGLAVAALGLSSRPTLFDGYEVAWYPRMFERIPEEARKLWKPLAYRDLRLGAPVFDNADFERGTLEGWTRHGDAFPEEPLAGEPWMREGRPAVPEGRYWMSSRQRGRGGTSEIGRLASRAFVIEGNTIAFKLGAATRPDETYVVFLVEGREVARFWASETLDRMDLVRFDVRAYRGASMTIEIVDEALGAHVNVDGFRYAP
jgi:hypothetical protein